MPGFPRQRNLTSDDAPSLYEGQSALKMSREWPAGAIFVCFIASRAEIFRTF